jgi:hypothetical protein
MQWNIGLIKSCSVVASRICQGPDSIETMVWRLMTWKAFEGKWSCPHRGIPGICLAELRKTMNNLIFLSRCPRRTVIERLMVMTPEDYSCSRGRVRKGLTTENSSKKCSEAES